MSEGSIDRTKQSADDALRALDARLDRALAAPPEFVLPRDFAARVIAALPVEPRHSPAAPMYGRAVLLGCGVLLVVVLVFLLPQVTREPRWLVSLLSIELAAVALGAGPWRRALGWVG